MKNKKIKVVFKVIYYSTLFALISLALLLILTLIPEFGGFRVLIVQSGSMEPTIKTGSVILIKAVADYQINDIITFGDYPKRRRDISTTHRIHDIKQDSGQKVYQTKGDANEGPDATLITRAQIWGKVLFSLPYIGYGVAEARRPVGLITVIILPAMLIILDEIKKIWLEIKKMRQRTKTNPS